MCAWHSTSLLQHEHMYYVPQCSSQVGKRAGCKRNWAQSNARTTKIRAQFSAQTTQNRAQFRARTTKIRSQSSTRTKRGLGTILWAIDGHKSASVLQAFLHWLSENTKTAITFCKNNFLFNYIFFLYSGRARINRAGRKSVRAGRSALRNRPSWM